MPHVSADDIACYQAERIARAAAPKTVNLEVGTLRSILRKNRLWAAIQPDVWMLRVREDIGRAISRDEEVALLEACRASPPPIQLEPFGVKLFKGAAPSLSPWSKFQFRTGVKLT